jgi:hypothetical protein
VIAPADVGELQGIIDDQTGGSACNGYQIYLLEGDYILQATIYVNNGCNIRIYGRGVGLTNIRRGTSLNDSMVQIWNNSVLALYHVTVRDGAASVNGTNASAGAIHIYDDGTLETYDSEFVNNVTTGFGGAIDNSAGQLFSFRTDFVANQGNTGSAYYSYGWSQTSQPYVEMNCARFEDNVASQFTGAMSAYNFGEYSSITGSSFINNRVQSTDIWDETVVHIHSYAYQYNEAIDALLNATDNWWDRSTGPIGWEVAHDAIDDINPKVDVSSWLSSPPYCEKEEPYPLPGDFCPAGGGESFGALQDECPLTLADFGIVLEGTWSQTEKAEILTAAIETGTALFAHGAGGTITEAFREVMQGMNGSQYRQIRFSRINAGGVYCTTTKNPTAAFSAYIQCDTEIVMNQYTAVHEFGHVFVGRTTVSGISRYLEEIENPTGIFGQPLEDINGVSIFGYTGYDLQIGPRLDWQRSNVITDNGWGSAALWNNTVITYDFLPPPAPTPTPFPLVVPLIGPCGDGAPSTLPIIDDDPFPFQQNPCTFPDWEASSSSGILTEIEEAAADMFLNWVYWKNYGSAFLDNLWRSSSCYPNGCVDPGESGQVRSTWMNERSIL